MNATTTIPPVVCGSLVRPAPDAAGFWACRYRGKTIICEVYPVLRSGWIVEMLFVRFASARVHDCLVVELPDGGEWLPIEVTWPNAPHELPVSSMRWLGGVATN